MSYLSWADGIWNVSQASLGHHVRSKNEETLSIWHIEDFDDYQKSLNPQKHVSKYGYVEDYKSQGTYITYLEAKDLNLVMGKLKYKYRWKLMRKTGWEKLNPYEQEQKEEEYFFHIKKAVKQWIADIDKKWLDPHHRKDIVERKEKKKKLVLDRKAKAKYLDKKRKQAISLDI